MGALAGEDRDRVVRDHRPHPRDVADGGLGADQGKARTEHHDSPTTITAFTIRLRYIPSMKVNMTTVMVAVTSSS
ncbi:MAG: hypothetical protein KIT69_04410 [Propionibacteriaceae bacterium]|nr:hypothetical protein [Propionibacteriaceae bacterium]